MIEAIRRGARFYKILIQDDSETETIFTLPEAAGGAHGKLIEGQGAAEGRRAAYRHGHEHDKYGRLVAERGESLPESQRQLWTESLDHTGQHTALPPEVRHTHDPSA